MFLTDDGLNKLLEHLYLWTILNNTTVIGFRLIQCIAYYRSLPGWLLLTQSRWPTRWMFKSMVKLMEECFSQGSYCCVKTSWPKHFGEERVYLAYISTSLFIIEGNQGRNSERQELADRNWNRNSEERGLLLLACLACFLIQLRATCPRVTSAHLHQSLIKKIHYRLTGSLNGGIVLN